LIKGRSSQQTAFFAKHEKSLDENDTQTTAASSLSSSLSPSSKNSNSPPKPQQPLLCIEVIDNGIGVPESHKRQLFRPFQQTQRMAGGTGLGLYSLAKRCEALQGEYGVRDREDGAAGSVFFFAVPYRPDIIAAEVLKTAREAAQEASQAQNVKSDSALPVLVPRIPRQHSLSAPSSRSKSMSFSAKGVAMIDNLAPLVIQRQDSSAKEISRPRVACADNDDKESKLLQKRGSFLIAKAFPTTEGIADMVVKIVGIADNSDVAKRTTPTRTVLSASAKQSSQQTGANQVANSYLPVISQAKSEKDSFPTEVSRSTTEKRKLKLLLVEDSTTIAKMTSALLKRQGHSVSVAGNGVVAVETVQSDESFDIILMDLQMPVMDGIEATRRIRSLETTGMIKRRQRIVGLSANSDIDTVTEPFDAGFDAFMEKPIEIDVFESTAAELMVWA
jgi:CheY-like chemotaxis protein